MVKVLDSKFEGCEFKTHTGHGSFSKLRQFRLPYFASVYSAANEYKHCLEGTCRWTSVPSRRVSITALYVASHYRNQV